MKISQNISVFKCYIQVHIYYQHRKCEKKRDILSAFLCKLVKKQVCHILPCRNGILL